MTPDGSISHREDSRWLLDGPGEGSLRAVARGKSGGWTNRAIAVRLGCIEKSVERKLRSIRRLWSEDVAS
jgi:hypothetical protein